jgi:hypothetical protein
MIKAYASFPEPSRSWNFVSTLKIIAMKNIYLLFFALTIGTVHQAQGDFTWAIFDNYTAQHDNYCFDLAMDSENNLISVGRSSKSSGTDNQAVVYKHDSDGNEEWKTTFNYTQYLSDAQVKIASNNDIVLTLNFRGDLTIGTTVLSGYDDIALIKIDKDGAVLWSAHDGRTAGGESTFAITIDDNDNIYYAGGHVPFKTYVGTDSITGGGQTFIACYNSDGVYQWVRLCSKGLRSLDHSSTHLFAYGSPGAGLNNFGDSTVSGLTDAFLAKFDFNGNLVSITGEDEVVPKSLLVLDDRVLTTGIFTTTATIAGSTVTPANSVDSYIGYYDFDLAGQKYFQVTATDYTNGVMLAESAKGHYCLLGNHAGDVSFAGSTVVGSGFSHNVYVLEFDENDTEIEAYGIFGVAASTATEIEEASIAAGTNNDFYVNGYLKGRGTFGTLDVNPGGNKIHMWLAQIGTAGALGSKEIKATYLNSISVFPNPFSDVLNVYFDKPLNGDLILIDMNGRTVLRRELNADHCQISVSHLAKGIYSLSVKSKSGQRFVEQVVIM